MLSDLALPVMEHQRVWAEQELPIAMIAHSKRSRFLTFEIITQSGADTQPNTFP